MPHVVDEQKLKELLRGPNGAVMKDMIRRTLRVEAAAKRNLGSNPKRVNTGRLRSSITHRIRVERYIVSRVGTNVAYARYVHDGTGIYGPRGAMIVPVNKKVLRWVAPRSSGRRSKKSTSYVFSMRSRGMQPNEFLKNALKAARR